MKISKWILSGLFMVVLAIPGAAFAHDGDGNGGGDGRGAWSHGGDCPMSSLPEAKRQLLHETMKKVFEKDKASLEQMHKLHHQLHGILAAGTFDRQAFVSTTAQIEKIRDRIHRDRMEAFASIAAQFTPEEREMLAKMHGRHHHGHDGAGHHHDGEWGDHSMNDGSSAPPAETDYPPYPSR